MPSTISTFYAKALLGLFTFVVLSLLQTKTASASVGLVEMRSTTQEDYRCFASSLIMPNNRFDVAINCVNIIFPVNPPEISFYVVWANLVNGRNPAKLGDLGKGIVRFEVQQPFTTLFVTLENNLNVRAPSQNVVMSGAIAPIAFLQRPTSPTPTPEVQETEGEGNGEESPTAQLSTRDKLLLALRRAGIAAVIALIAIVGLIFVVTRSRG